MKKTKLISTCQGLGTKSTLSHAVLRRWLPWRSDQTVLSFTSHARENGTHNSSSTLTTALLCLTVFATVIVARSLITNQLPLIQHESLSALPQGWELDSTADPSQLLSLQVALSHAETRYLDVARDVTDPTSPNYGQYLTVNGLQRNLPDTRLGAQLVSLWLKGHSIVNITTNGDWLGFDTTVATAAALLGSDFNFYRYGSNHPILRTTAYSVPQELRDYIDFIYPTVHFMRPNVESKTLQARQHIPTGNATCQESVCPINLVSKYNITYRPKDGLSGSRIGVGGFLEQYPDHVDTRQFLKDYAVGNYNKSYDYTVVPVNEGQSPDTPAKSGREAILDIEYVLGIAYPLPVTFYSTGGRPITLNQPGNRPVPMNESGNEPWLALFKHLLALEFPPQVVPLSCADDEQSVPLPYARRVCNLAAQLASRGMSLIVASGDGGATGAGVADCKGPNGEQRFVPSFPPSCPWVTSVGATDRFDSAAHYSGGGFSNYFERPSWQDTAVVEYQKLLKNAHSGWYNKTGRGFPDLALIGDDYLTLSSNNALQQCGTSASTLVFAAVVALLNDKRLRAGKPVLGFLNPLLYNATIQRAFKDVIDGTNDGCVVKGGVEEGFSALKGWDAISGLGQPNFAELMELLG